eukprot:TRINITY_DN3100_c0_g1_i4.p2 TRINITY_DN3100_c0_g1~~TRINITY_DN3100_c0_g1_i4.p2  ORF type:complete len:126 (-),score=18.79 TRINITY_DN3100_c0_g1_i4:96-473(-)
MSKLRGLVNASAGLWGGISRMWAKRAVEEVNCACQQKRAEGISQIFAARAKAWQGAPDQAGRIWKQLKTGTLTMGQIGFWLNTRKYHLIFYPVFGYLLGNTIGMGGTFGWYIWADDWHIPGLTKY